MGQTRRKRAWVEGLEGRWLLAAHVWTGAGDGLYWSNPLNWNGSAPMPGESSVTLDFPADDQPVALYNDINGLAVQSVTFEGAYTLSGSAVTLGGSIATGGFAVDWTVPISLSADTTLGGGTTRAASPTSFMITGPIGGTGNVTIAADSSVTFASSANNTYSGATIVDGTLTLDSSAPGFFVRVGASFEPGGAAIPHDLTIDSGGAVNTQTDSFQLATAGNVTVNAGGTLNLDGTTDLVATVTGDGRLAGDGTLVVTGGGDFSGRIDDSVSVLVGAGASSTFGPGLGQTSGTIAQISGDLILNNAQLPNAQVSDNFDFGAFSQALYRGWVGRLRGGGTVGSLVAQGEFVQPGGPGLPPLNVVGDVTLGSNSTLQFNTQFGPTQTVIAGGAVTLGGGTFSLSDGLGSGNLRPARGTIYTLIDNRGSAPISGTFNNLPNGSLILSGSDQWRIHYNGGDGNDVTLAYLGRDTSVTVSSDANPAVFGHAVLHAAVSVNVGMPDAPLSGTVTFFADGIAIGSALLDPNATASLDALTLTPGLHSITAAYSGDANEYESSTSPGALPLRVTQSTPIVTLMPPTGDGPLSVVVQQTDAPGVVPGGQVTLIVDGSPMPALAMDASGEASFEMSSLATGTHMLTAIYAGDANFAAAATAAPTMITVVPQIALAGAAATVPPSGTANLLFPVTLSDACTTPVTVNYATQDVSGHAGQDYVAESGTLTFAPGQTSQTVSVPLIGRANWLPDLTLSLILFSPAGATLASTTATGTIQSADGVPAAGRLVPDELDPSQTDLVVDGTAGNDVILVRPTKVSGQVQVLVNNAIVASESGIARVIVYGGAGNDRITADPKLGGGVIFFGGDGNDTLTGGAANDILIGGAGADALVSGNGSNLLIGGDGADRLKGSRLGDILVGGATPYDSGHLSDLLKLESILSVWTNGAAYSTRVAQISSAMPSGWNLNGSLTTDSSLRDSFAGANSHDWLVRTLTAQARLQHAVGHPRGR